MAENMCHPLAVQFSQETREIMEERRRERLRYAVDKPGNTKLTKMIDRRTWPNVHVKLTSITISLPIKLEKIESPQEKLLLQIVKGLSIKISRAKTIKN